MNYEQFEALKEEWAMWSAWYRQLQHDRDNARSGEEVQRIDREISVVKPRLDHYELMLFSDQRPDVTGDQ